MYCRYCGKYNDKENKFCIECGKPTRNLEPQKKEDDSENIALIMGISSFIGAFTINIFCLVPGIIGIVYSLKNKKQKNKYGVGFILSIIGILLGILFFVITIIMIILIIHNYSEEYIDFPMFPIIEKA